MPTLLIACIFAICVGLFVAAQAQSTPFPGSFPQGTFTNRAGIDAGVSTTTYDPSKKSTNMVLSNGNLTVTGGASIGNYEDVLSVHGNSAGLIYFEMTAATNLMFAGIGNSSTNFGSGNFLGADLNSMGWLSSSGGVFINGSATTTIQTFASGDTAGVAYDLTHSKIWFITFHAGSCGNWNNDVIGNQNPANNTGGISISGLNAGPYFAGSTLHDVGAANTANFGASSYHCQPAGYSNQ